MSASTNTQLEFYQKPLLRRNRHTALTNALGQSPLKTCFTRTGFLVKSAKWTEPTLAAHHQVLASLSLGAVHAASLTRIREAIHADTSVRRMDLIHVIDCAVHACVKHARPVRSQVALGAFQLVSAIHQISERQLGKPLPVNKNSVHLQRLGIPGMGPLTWTQIFNIYHDVLLHGPAYTSHALTVTALALLRDLLMYDTLNCASVENILSENKDAACAILGLALLASPQGGPGENQDGYTPLPYSATTLGITQGAYSMQFDFASQSAYSTFVIPNAKRPWIMSHETFSSIAAAALADAPSQCAYGKNILIESIKGRLCVQISTSACRYRMRPETFKHLQLLIDQFLKLPETAGWTRFQELTTGVF
jgi:hypothetical protein